MITIHYDFTDGTEVSYSEGLRLTDDFTTNCLDFFSMDTKVDDVIVLKKDGSQVSRKNILLHTDKDIRHEHDIHKMLVAGAFEFIDMSNPATKSTARLEYIIPGAYYGIWCAYSLALILLNGNVVNNACKLVDGNRGVSKVKVFVDGQGFANIY